MTITYTKTQKLQILFIGSTYPLSPSDHQVPWLRESIRKLGEEGHSVTVLAPAYKGSKTHQIDGVEVRRFRYAPAKIETLTHGSGAPVKSRKLGYKLLVIPYILMGSLATLSEIFRKRYDLIHVHWPFPHGLFAMFARVFRRLPMVCTCHGAELAVARKNPLVSTALALSLRKAEAVTCNSSHTKNAIRRVSGRTAQIIPYGVTIKPAPTAEKKDSDVPTLLFCGRLIPRKGLQYLLSAMPMILKQRQVKLVITGDGVSREPLQRLARHLGIEEHVRFAGFVSNEELANLYRKASVYVHPAIHDENGDTEGLGVVLVEALMNKLPVVASAVGGIVDVIQHERTGLLVPEKDAQRLAGSVLRVLADKCLARMMGEQGYRHAAWHFDWDRITRETIKVYDSVLPSKPSTNPTTELATREA